MGVLNQLIEWLLGLFSNNQKPEDNTIIPEEVAVVSEEIQSIPSIEIVQEPSNEKIEEIEEVKPMNTDFLSGIHKMFLDSGQYIKEENAKFQIYLHHTAGNASGRNTISNWNTDSRGRIATCVTVSNKGASNSPDGEIVQAFSSKHWAYHLGLKQEHFDRFDLPYVNIDKFSIGIELCAWGPLTLKDGKFYNYVNRQVPEDEVCQLLKQFKGYTYYHKYSDAQIESVKNLLLYWSETYNIPLEYNEDIWDLTERAYKLEPGVYTHNSVRKDKTDVFPQPSLIEMLKSLS